MRQETKRVWSSLTGLYSTEALVLHSFQETSLHKNVKKKKKKDSSYHFQLLWSTRIDCCVYHWLVASSSMKTEQCKELAWEMWRDKLRSPPALQKKDAYGSLEDLHKWTSNYEKMCNIHINTVKNTIGNKPKVPHAQFLSIFHSPNPQHCSHARRYYIKCHICCAAHKLSFLLLLYLLVALPMKQPWHNSIYSLLGDYMLK